MTKHFTLTDSLRMVSDTKRLIAGGMTAEDAAIKAGFTGYAQYYQQAKRVGQIEETPDKPAAAAHDWVKSYVPQPLPDAPEPPDVSEPEPKPDSDNHVFDLRPDPNVPFCILLEQMRIVQDLSRTCIVPSDMAILSDALIRLAEEITD